MKKLIVIFILILSALSCEKEGEASPLDNLPENTEVEINGMSPDHGSAGTLVTITGNNFLTGTTNQSITINGINAEIVEATTTKIVFRIPLEVNSGHVVLEINGNNYQGSQFTYEPSWQVSTFVGTRTQGYADGSLQLARFNRPGAMAIDSNDNIYCIDGNNRIRKITPQGNVTTVAGNGMVGSADGPALSVPITGYGIAIGPNNDVFFADQNCIKKIANGNVITVAGNKDETGLTDGFGLAARLYPSSMTNDQNGNIYFIQFHTDFGDHPRCVRKLDTNGYVSTITTSSLIASLPRGITYANDGNLYMTNEWNFNILKIIPSNGVTTVYAGNPVVTTSSSCLDGQGTNARFGYTYGITSNAAHELLLINVGCTSVGKINSSGYFSAFASANLGSGSDPAYHYGVSGYLDGLAWNAQFNQPRYIITSSNGDIFISDYGNNCIRKIHFG